MNATTTRSASACPIASRVAETEARLHAVVAESKALKGEAAENDIKLQSLRQEVAALKVQYACVCYPSLSSDKLDPALPQRLR